jgi:predicted enzyme related to lactoylglutathione lyase
MVDKKLELVVLPVSDVDRAKAFYERPASGSTSIIGPARSSASCS